MALGIWSSGYSWLWLYDITIVYVPKDMSLEKHILISQKKIHDCLYEFLCRVDGSSLFIMKFLSKLSLFNLHNAAIIYQL